MSLERQDILASRACRSILKDQRYTRARTRALIRWLKSDFEPTSDIAGRAIAMLGPLAFEDLLADALQSGPLPLPNFVWALEQFPEQHEKLLAHLRDWLVRSVGRMQMQCAVSIAHILAERLRKGLMVEAADELLFKSVLLPLAAQNGAVRVHLRGYEEAAARHRL